MTKSIATLVKKIKSLKNTRLEISEEIDKLENHVFCLSVLKKGRERRIASELK